MEWRTRKPEDMEAVAEALLSTIEISERATVLALSGELGAGKTTFVQFLANALGIGERVTSPTFVIQKRFLTDHPSFTSLVHIDAYRLESGDELEVLGWYDTLSDPRTLVALEWPENVKEALPEESINIAFEYDGEGRQITVSNL